MNHSACNPQSFRRSSWRAAAVACAAMCSGCGWFGWGRDERVNPETAGGGSETVREVESAPSEPPPRQNTAALVERPPSKEADAARPPDGRSQEPVRRAEKPKPKTAQDFVARAEAAIQEGREDEALALLAQAIEKNPALTVAHMGMGDIYRMRGDYAEAESKYRRAAELEPRNFDAQYYHGLMLQLLDRLGEAVRAYLRALAIRPDDFNANLNLATAYIQLKEASQSLPYARRAVELSPTSGPAHANLGAVYSELGRHQEAVAEYEAAAELMELSPQLMLNLADSLGKIERYQEMVYTLDALLRIEVSAGAHERMGFAQFKLRNYTAAQEHFRTSLALDENYYPALNGLGVCLLNEWITGGKQNNATRDEAVSLLRKSLRINRDQPRIVELLSRYG